LLLEITENAGSLFEKRKIFGLKRRRRRKEGEEKMEKLKEKRKEERKEKIVPLSCKRLRLPSAQQTREDLRGPGEFVLAVIIIAGKLFFQKSCIVVSFEEFSSGIWARKW